MSSKIHDEYVIDIDSDERDPAQYPNPNDYVVKLSRPVYDVSNIKVESARIPRSQYLINEGNRQVQVDGTTYILTQGNYDGNTLATQLQSDLASSNINSVTFEPSLQRLNFTGTNNFSFKFYTGSNGFSTNTVFGTPYEVLGFNALDTAPSSNLFSNVIDLQGASSLILRITSDRGDITKPVHINNGEFSFESNVYNANPSGPLNMHYFGRFLSGDETSIEHYFNDDPVESRFHEGNESEITELRIRWYWNIGNKLIPYDFGMRNHILKLKFNCCLDKLKLLQTPTGNFEVNDPIEEYITDSNNPHNKMDNKKILLAALICFLFIMMMKFKR
jgi:hypothetical protein